MCIAIVSPGDQSILPIDHFNESYKGNPDGMGIAFVKDDAWHVAKSLSDCSTIYRTYRWAHDQGLNCLLHFRRATHGDVSIENCHPFVHRAEMFMHNGVLSFNDLPKNEVDSKAFSYRILQHMPDAWRDMPDIVKMLERFLGGSKIVLMDLEQNVTILNERDGHWLDGRWYSNSSYKAYTRSYNRKYHGWAPGWEWDKDSSSYVDKDEVGFKALGKGKDITKGKSAVTVTTYDDADETVKIEEYPDYQSWYKAQHKEVADEEQLALVESSMHDEIVGRDDPYYDNYPHGFEYQGYEMCSLCVPLEIAADAQVIPLWVVEHDDYFVCESCNVWVSPSSPKRFTVPFDLATELPMFDVLDWVGSGSMEVPDA